MDEVERAEYACDEGWAEHEFGKADFGDDRLTKRMVRVAEDLSARPQMPINHASEDWAATKAAYRLFANEKIHEQELFRVHQENTSTRLRGEKVVLAVQDTTYLNYLNHEACKDLGYTNSESSKGVVLHLTLAITPKGLPLGLLTHDKRLRQKPRDLTTFNNTLVRIEEKESFCWIRALRETVKHASGAELVVTVGDREADIYEFFQEAEKLGAHCVIRAAKNRAILGDTKTKIFEAVRAEAAQGELEVSITSREGRKGRIARVAVRYRKVTLRPPQNRPKKILDTFSPVEVFLVSAEEIDPPEQVSPLSWTLITNVAVESYDEAVERIAWYKARWQIEIFNKVLKSGCKVEDCRLGTVERLHRYIVLMSIVAWRIYWFTHVSRTDPNAPAETVLTASEHEALSLLAGRKKKQRVPIKTARQAVIEIAKLGGFLARRHDGHPGPTVIWRGWQRLSDASEMFEIISAQNCG